MNIETPVPKYTDSQNPQLFLEKLESYFKLKQISDENRVHLLDKVFEGKAKIWFDLQSWNDYGDFKRKFVDEFYSIPVRVRIKANWLAKRSIRQRISRTRIFLVKLKMRNIFLLRWKSMSYIIQ